LLVFGESPVSDALLRLGHVMGYRVVAVRPDATMAAPAEADLVLDTLDVSHLVPGWRTAAVVASMGVYDEDAIERALRAGVGFVGLVASRRRFAAVAETLRAAGIGDDQLAHLKAPAGLDIAATAPEEIAVSILAEVIARKATLPYSHSDTKTELAPTTAIDPVCGMTVEIANARHIFDHEGHRYYFCCPACRRAFSADPASHLAVG
jgi:xanthine dehydrogenase accessory factor